MAAAGTITLTRVQFELEIKALLEALSRVVNLQAEDGLGISKHCAVSSPNDTKGLIHWERQTTQDGHLYLIHPTEIRTLETSAENNVCIEDDLYDVSVDQEDERIVSQPQPLEMNSHDKCTEWFFSIVLSDTWLVPVLYFRVQRMDGTPCLRQDILSYCNHDDLGVKDSWDFISQEEHAITGEPSFFLHPCQTSARLAKLQTNNPNTKDSALVPGTLLLSFLSMILPAVRSRISPTNYSRIYHELLQIAANDNTNR